MTFDSMIDCVWGDRGALGKIPSDKDRLQTTISRLRKRIDHLELSSDPIVAHTQQGYSFSPKPRNTD